MLIHNNTLYIVATPIGNLADITYRAIYLLKQASIILCEDTRLIYKLLNRYDISTENKKLIVHNKDNEIEEEFIKILQFIKDDNLVVLVSDAGTPCVSDPGAKLINFLINNNINIDFLPGPCAAIAALVLSGFESNQFTFLGFAPKTEESKKKFFEKIKTMELAIKDIKNLTLEISKNITNSMAINTNNYIFYETSDRLVNTLEILSDVLHNQKISIAREITKLNQEVIRDNVANLISNNASKLNHIKGEIVVIININLHLLIQNHNIQEFEENIIQLLNKNIAIKDIAHIISEKYPISKNYAYKLACQLKEEI
ncbi:MAG: 16S rRNA (cytidine(1402)-2'-O)-methyltransferase [Rickettsiales bacterium]